LPIGIPFLNQESNCRFPAFLSSRQCSAGWWVQFIVNCLVDQQLRSIIITQNPCKRFY